MEFSEQILNKAIKSVSDELAWKKDDIFAAIDEISQNNFAILGGDVWAVMSEQNDSNVLVLTQLDHSYIAVGIIEGKDGVDYVFSWDSDKTDNESWNDYVERSKTETINSINNLKPEESVAQNLRESIYYNLVFADENEYKSLQIAR